MSVITRTNYLKVWHVKLMLLQSQSSQFKLRRKPWILVKAAAVLVCGSSQQPQKQHLRQSQGNLSNKSPNEPPPGLTAPLRRLADGLIDSPGSHLHTGDRRRQEMLSGSILNTSSPHASGSGSHQKITC